MITTKDDATLLESLIRSGGWKVVEKQLNEWIEQHEAALLGSKGLNTEWNKAEYTMYDVIRQVRSYLIDTRDLPHKIIKKYEGDNTVSEPL